MKVVVSVIVKLLDFRLPMQSALVCGFRMKVAVSVIVKLLDFRLPMQSAPITTNVVCSIPNRDDVYPIQREMINFIIGLPVSG